MLELGAILVAGFWAGMINVVVGSGTLVTFPVLLLFGYPPLTANISNNIGLVAGGLAGTWGYRKELAPNRGLLLRLLPASAAGGLAGALLLLVLPASAFKTIVPALIMLGLAMVAGGPALQRAMARRRAQAGADAGAGSGAGAGAGSGAGASAAGLAGSRLPSRGAVGLVTGVGVLGIYGGYFGAAQGILLVGFLGLATTLALQQINAVKNVLTTVVNALAAVVFLIVAPQHIDWGVVAVIAVGALLGGLFGARFGRALPPTALRATILLVGTAALIKMVFFP